MRSVASFEIAYRQFLDPEGRVLGALPEFARDPAALLRLYRFMVLARTFDAKAISLQRTGRLGTYPPCLGEEAVGVGLASAMGPDDVLLPSHREQPAQLWRGVSPVEILLYWGGDERGSDFAVPKRDFPICVPVGSQAPHAAGVALAMKLRGERRVSVCCIGDGGTSKGDFYEAINLAGAMKLPAVFVVANNQWAISVPRSAQTGASTLAQKAVAAGIPGEQVDGNDVIAVGDALRRAIETARGGGGASLIEALTYRLGHHTTVDERLYRAFAEDVSDDGSALPLDVCFTLREGRDLTFVSWGAMTREVLAAADALTAAGISAAVIDLATLKPLDIATILASVEKTGRCVVVHEAPLTAGYGAEVAARLAEHGLTSLLAPVQRVAGYDTVMPLPRLEGHYVPSKERILAAAHRALEFA